MNEEITLFSEDIERLNPGTLFFSNRLERLVTSLQQKLFEPPSTPFSERLVIVPSQAIERWIRLQLADHLSIAAGITTSFLNQGALSLCMSPSFLPTKLELTLRIEEVISAHLHETEPKWEPLIRYVGERPRRAMRLSMQLAHLFQRYSIYGVKTWKSEWQHQVWDEVFATWTHLGEVLQRAPLISKEMTVHLFGFSHLPPLFFHFFQRVAKKYPLYFYALSPCQEFWSDLPSDAQMRHLSLQFLEERHPLLANLGKVGKQFAALVEEHELQTEEEYETQGLTPTQQSLLHLTTLGVDPTIEIHSTSTRLREVEILHNNLLSLVDEVEPKDILVMAPDISIYAAAIQAEFGSLCHIADLPTLHLDLEVTGLWLLLTLEQKRWSAPALLELFRHPLFQKKQGWDVHKLMQVRQWILQAGVRWGVDAAHRSQLLADSVTDEGATWRGGFHQLLEELATSSDRIEWSQAELLGELIHIVETLHLALRPLHTPAGRTVQEWACYLKELYQTYFAFEEKKIEVLLDSLAAVCCNKSYCFATLMPLLQQLLQEEGTTYYSHDVQAIRFCSLLPMRAIPARVICLIGMNHDAFPRKENHFSLDQLQSSDAATQTDLDRYLFLETLLSVRDKLIISYLGQNPLDGSEEPPAAVVSELLPYTTGIIKHPLRSYDPRYFSAERGLVNYSTVDFAWSQASQEELIEPTALFIRPKNPPMSSHEHPGLDVQDLLRAARSPLQHYYAPLSFYEADPIKEDEEFTLSALHMSRFKKYLLQMSKEEAFERLRTEGKLPLGYLAQVAQAKVGCYTHRPTMTYELLPHIENKVQIGQQLWQVPAVRSDEGVLLVGRLEGIVAEGLLTHDKATVAAAVKQWPLYLLLACCEEKPQLLFLDACKPCFFSDPRLLLQRFLNYYFLSLTNPSPLFPQCIEPLLKGDEKGLKKALEESYDPALQWALQTHTLSAEMIVWQEEARKLYGEMYDAWF